MPPPPRFFTFFLSQLSSESLLIPSSFYDELPLVLPETAILQNSGGSWNVAMMKRREEVYLGKGWARFVEDNSLTDGDFMTFVYDEERVFEVSIYGRDGCKETRAAVTELDDDDDKEETEVDDDDDKEDTEVENDESKEETEGDDAVSKEDSIFSLSTQNSDTSSEAENTDASAGSEMINITPRRENKGKEAVEISDEESESEYLGEFGSLSFEESSESDSAYSPVCEVTSPCVQSMVTDPNTKGKSKVTEVEDVDVIGDSSHSVIPSQKRDKILPKIKNPEAYLDNPNNAYFETGLKNRKYELLVGAQMVKDYDLKFQDYIHYIDKAGKLLARTARWKDQRVCIKRWGQICKRNKLVKNDRVLCEILRKGNMVFAIKLHVVREKDL